VATGTTTLREAEIVGSYQRAGTRGHEKILIVGSYIMDGCPWVTGHGKTRDGTAESCPLEWKRVNDGRDVGGGEGHISYTRQG